MNNHAFSKIWIIATVVVFILAVFLWPKSCGKWYMGPVPKDKTESWTTFTESCDCVGLRYAPVRLGGGSIYCFGIPISAHCYEFSGGGEIEVPCLEKEKVSTTNWTGIYEYSEFAPGVYGSDQTWAYKLEIYKEEGQLKARLDTDGWMTLTRIQATAQEREGNLDIVFDSYRPENMYEPYKKGDLLFSLEKVSSQEYRILWNKMQSNLLEPGEARLILIEE